MLCERKLLDDLKVSVDSEHLKRLQVIDREDYSGVIRKTRETLPNNLSTDDVYLQNGIRALKQYYAVALLDPANAHAVSAEVDPFWHAHILHSEKYERFCKSVVGEYMHHQPLDRSNLRQMKNIRTLYEYTIEVLNKVFCTVDAHFWPTSVPDIKLICYHKGNVEAYPDIQRIRLFEPNVRGRSYAFAS